MRLRSIGAYFGERNRWACAAPADLFELRNKTAMQKGRIETAYVKVDYFADLCYNRFKSCITARKSGGKLNE